MHIFTIYIYIFHLDPAKFTCFLMYVSLFFPISTIVSPTTDTSGSLNLCTPLSGKDFTREFTSRIQERCQIGQISCQKATTILDPSSGKITTILAPGGIHQQQQQRSLNNSNSSTSSTAANASSETQTYNDDDGVTTSPAKKPSYLNLACCVNGYSNLTTYDSKLRQNINKSREVSPIRPITHTLQYNRGGQYLVVPISVPTTSAADANDMDAAISPEKHRYYTTSVLKSNMNANGGKVGGGGGKDVTDNVVAYKSPRPSAVVVDSSVVMVDNNTMKSPKSFIQQRVERLYGPGALAQGFYSPKRSSSDSASASSVLSERSQNSTVQTKLFKLSGSNGGGGGVTNTISAPNTVASSTSTTAPPKEVENVHFISMQSADEKSLPVFRHLRPEFRAQLPIVSPKRTLAKTDFGNSAHLNGAAVVQQQVTSITTTQQQQKLHKQICVSSNGFHSSSSSSSAAVTKQTSTNGSDGGRAAAGSYYNTTDEEETRVQVNKMKICDDTNVSIVCGGGEAAKAAANGGGQVQVILAETLEPAAAPDLPVPIIVTAALATNGGDGTATTSTTNNAATNGSTTNGTNVNTVITATKDGHYFLEILRAERDRLIQLAATAETYMATLLTVSFILIKTEAL